MVRKEAVDVNHHHYRAKASSLNRATKSLIRISKKVSVYAYMLIYMRPETSLSVTKLNSHILSRLNTHQGTIWQTGE